MRLKFGDSGIYDPPYKVLYQIENEVKSIECLCIGKACDTTVSKQFLLYMGEDYNGHSGHGDFDFTEHPIYKEHCRWAIRSEFTLMPELEAPLGWYEEIASEQEEQN